MKRRSRATLPEPTRERILDRFAEVAELMQNREKFAIFPKWTRKVLSLLRQQLLPDERITVLTAQQEAFQHGVVIASTANVRDWRDMSSPKTVNFVQDLLDRMAGGDPEAKTIAAQVHSGEAWRHPELQQHVINMIFTAEAPQRRAFAEGLAFGHRIGDLVTSGTPKTTDATAIHFTLWLYWPEIDRMGSVGEVARALEPLWGNDRNALGSDWEERFRKLANRVGLSFRTRQKRRSSARK